MAIAMFDSGTGRIRCHSSAWRAFQELHPRSVTGSTAGPAKDRVEQDLAVGWISPPDTIANVPMVRLISLLGLGHECPQREPRY
jgi:hypothetical protein